MITRAQRVLDLNRIENIENIAFDDHKFKNCSKTGFY